MTMLIAYKPTRSIYSEWCEKKSIRWRVTTPIVDSGNDHVDCIQIQTHTNLHIAGGVHRRAGIGHRRRHCRTGEPIQSMYRVIRDIRTYRA